MCWAAEQGFQSDARTPAAARAFVRSELTNLLGLAHNDAPLPDVELVVSELVTNAVRAGAATIRVELQVHRDEMNLHVADDGPGWPRLTPPDERDSCGRGLVLVDALADRWQVEQLSDGIKRVIVTIGVPDGSAAALVCERPHGRSPDGGG